MIYLGLVFGCVYCSALQSSNGKDTIEFFSTLVGDTSTFRLSLKAVSLWQERMFDLGEGGEGTCWTKWRQLTKHDCKDSWHGVCSSLCIKTFMLKLYMFGLKL